jgi:hypothetical protein
MESLKMAVVQGPRKDSYQRAQIRARLEESSYGVFFEGGYLRSFGK